MKTSPDQSIFVDTNILIYANAPDSDFGKQAVGRLNELAKAGCTFFISPQIIREYAHATLRDAAYHKKDWGESIQIVARNIGRFQRDFQMLVESDRAVQIWLGLLPSLTSYKDIFDFNIAAAMQAHGIGHILTHNRKDFEKFNDWLTILPLF